MSDSLFPLDAAAINTGIAPDFSAIEQQYNDYMKKVCSEATLTIPDAPFMTKGGKAGMHSEALGHLLAEMQWLQRAYPGATW